MNAASYDLKNSPGARNAALSWTLVPQREAARLQLDVGRLEEALRAQLLLRPERDAARAQRLAQQRLALQPCCSHAFPLANEPTRWHMGQAGLGGHPTRGARHQRAARRPGPPDTRARCLPAHARAARLPVLVRARPRCSVPPRQRRWDLAGCWSQPAVFLPRRAHVAGHCFVPPPQQHRNLAVRCGQSAALLRLHARVALRCIAPPQQRAGPLAGCRRLARMVWRLPAQPLQCAPDLAGCRSHLAPGLPLLARDCPRCFVPPEQRALILSGSLGQCRQCRWVRAREPGLAAAPAAAAHSWLSAWRRAYTISTIAVIMHWQCSEVRRLGRQRR